MTSTPSATHSNAVPLPFTSRKCALARREIWEELADLDPHAKQAA
jgi:hypothetical protein